MIKFEIYIFIIISCLNYILLFMFNSQTGEKMFVRKIKFDNNKSKNTLEIDLLTNDNEYYSSNMGPFVRFFNEFEGQKSLFRKEGIEFDSKQTQKLYNDLIR